MISRKDFTKIDHSYVASIDGALLSVESHGGTFAMYVYGALAELPSPEENGSEPTDIEWEAFLKLANELDRVRRLAGKHE